MSGGSKPLRRIRKAHGDITLSDFKALVREQFNMLLIDQEAALAAIPVDASVRCGDAA